MKNMHHKALIIAITSFISTQCAQKPFPTIEVYNKSNNNISVTIRSNQGTIGKDLLIYAGTAWRNPQIINVNNFDIYITDGGRSYQFYVNAPGKTKYLTWNPAKDMPLYPETGPLMGLMGKTESGLSLKNNLSSSMIQKR